MRAATSTSVPPALRTVRLFVNTWDIDAGIDQLQAPADLARWAADCGLDPPGARYTRHDLERARAAREGIRALLVANNGQQDAADTVAIAALDRVASAAPVRATFSDGHPTGWRAVGHRPIDRLLAQLLAAVQTAVDDGNWSRLKACREHGCRWAFYDTSRNKSGTWCSMAVCGNAAKQRAYVARRRAARKRQP